MLPILQKILPAAALLAAFTLSAAETKKPLELTKLPPAASAPVDFARDIQPLFVRHCQNCHGAEKQKGGLRLDLRQGALEGGDSGAVIVPGKSAESRLVHLVVKLDGETQMPPAGENRQPLTRDAKAAASLKKYFLTQVDPETRTLEKAVEDHAAKPPKGPDTVAATLAEEAAGRVTKVHIRGNFLDRGAEVRPGTPAVLHALKPRGARPPTAAELPVLRRVYDAQLQLAQATPENAAKLVEGTKDDARLAEKATLVALGRVLLNLDEFVTRD